MSENQNPSLTPIPPSTLLLLFHSNFLTIHSTYFSLSSPILLSPSNIDLVLSTLTVRLSESDTFDIDDLSFPHFLSPKQNYLTLSFSDKLILLDSTLQTIYSTPLFRSYINSLATTHRSLKAKDDEYRSTLLKITPFVSMTFDVRDGLDLIYLGRFGEERWWWTRHFEKALVEKGGKWHWMSAENAGKTRIGMLIWGMKGWKSVYEVVECEAIDEFKVDYWEAVERQGKLLVDALYRITDVGVEDIEKGAWAKLVKKVVKVAREKIALCKPTMYIEKLQNVLQDYGNGLTGCVDSSLLYYLRKLTEEIRKPRRGEVVFVDCEI